MRLQGDFKVYSVKVSDISNIMDPWSINETITSSKELKDQFQEWNKTKFSEKCLVSYNRVKQWICCLLKKEVSIPQGQNETRRFYKCIRSHD